MGLGMTQPPQSSSSLTHEQVRARAGQILIGFENADPSQLGKISLSAFEHVLSVYGGIDDYLIKAETQRLASLSGGNSGAFQGLC